MAIAYLMLRVRGKVMATYDRTVTNSFKLNYEWVKSKFGLRLCIV